MLKGQKYTLLVVILMLLILSLGTTACSSASAKLPENPPEITITAGPDQRQITYEILPNLWNNAIYDRLSYNQALAIKLEKGEVNQCQVGETITFDFGKYQPDQLVLKADKNTNPDIASIPAQKDEPVKTELLPTINIPLKDNSFELKADYAGYQNNTFFVLTATWDENNEVEYAFVVQISDPEKTEAAAGLISENPTRVRFLFTEQGEVWENYQVKEKDGKKALYTEDGQEVFPYEFEDFMTHYDMISVQKDGKWQLYDYKGELLSDDEWDDIVKTTTPMDNEVKGLVRVKKDGVWGCVDQQGRIVISPNWDEIHLNYYEEVEPYLRVKKDGKYGYLTYEGEMVLEAKWDMAVMDVYNSPLDEIYVRLNDEWGTVKVVNNKAQEVNWNQKPRIGTQIGFMDQRYDAQAQTVHDLLFSNRWGTSPSVILFFYDYYAKNQTEILNLPDFNGQNPDWDQLTKFVYTNSWDLRSSGEGEARSFLTEKEFDSIAEKYFAGIEYTHQPSKWLNYEDGKYTPVGWSDHGFRAYYLDKLRRIEVGENEYKFQAKLVGYYFWEDDFVEGADSVSPNMKALQKKAQESQYAGRTPREVLVQLIMGEQTDIFTPSVEHMIEFTIENPLSDVYLKYLSASRQEIEE